MKINQKLLVFIPKIPAYVDTDTEQSTDYIKSYLINKFLENKIGIVNDVKFTLIDKRDKSIKYYSCILFFKKWFENEYVEKYQQSIKKRTAKIFFNKDEFFYVYPQFNLKSDTYITERSSNSFQTNAQNNTELNMNDLYSVLVSQKNLILSIQQDFMFYFKTLEAKMECLKSQVEYNISLLRKEQMSMINGYYNQNLIFSDNQLNSRNTDIYNRNYTIDLTSEPSWDDSQPIESIQRKYPKYNHNSEYNSYNETDFINKLRSNTL